MFRHFRLIRRIQFNYFDYLFHILILIFKIDEKMLKQKLTSILRRNLFCHILIK